MTKSRPKTALIFGISGQDGAYLAASLLQHGYEVHGTSRDKENSSYSNLRRLGIYDRIIYHSAVLDDFRTVLTVIKNVKPAHIYNLAAQSSVGLSFEQPVETVDSIMHGTINIMEAIRFLRLDAKFYNAGSSECFGNTRRNNRPTRTLCFGREAHTQSARRPRSGRSPIIVRPMDSLPVQGCCSITNCRSGPPVSSPRRLSGVQWISPPASGVA